MPYHRQSIAKQSNFHPPTAPPLLTTHPPPSRPHNGHIAAVENYVVRRRRCAEHGGRFEIETLHVNIDNLGYLFAL